MDLVFRCPRLPRPGETLLGGSFSKHPGGKGANQAVAIGRLGGDVAFVGRVGNDPFGAGLIESLNAAGVRTEFVRVHPSAPTGSAVILVDSHGMNSIVVAAGANVQLLADEVSSAIAREMPEVVIAQLEIPMPAVAAASQVGRFVLNPAPAATLPADLVARCYVITPNEIETESLTGILPVDDASCLAAGRMLIEAGAKNVVITLGARGSYWVSAAGGRHFDAPTVAAIDTTGAGDAFNGALAMFLAEGRDLDNAIALSNCVGALSTTVQGAQESMPDATALRTVAAHLL
jgi:ribokinase